ncbi:antibiotic biosynthesis monooxygenase family protein [Streptomyces caelestis]|uniref:antibiotic biosynthesis monooxygenase family protein n=1 Tax=Streptomyces caelestis TaxID=36816 RepID=UPI0036642E82
MIARIWRATVLPGKESEYDAFAHEVSRPMFEQQDGFKGVFFLRNGTGCTVVSFWSDRTSAAALAESPSYGDTVERIRRLLHPETTTEVYEVQGTTFRIDPE